MTGRRVSVGQLQQVAGQIVDRIFHELERRPSRSIAEFVRSACCESRPAGRSVTWVAGRGTSAATFMNEDRRSWESTCHRRWSITPGAESGHRIPARGYEISRHPECVVGRHCRVLLDHSHPAIRGCGNAPGNVPNLAGRRLSPSGVPHRRRDRASR